MKALSILQPYAAAIIHGPKRCENRDWYMGYRGTLLIHAGKSKREMTPGYGYPYPFHFGALIGLVDVIDCLPMQDYIKRYGEDPWGCFGCFCIRMENPFAFAAPIPWRGQLGLFDVPAEILVSADMIEAAKRGKELKP